MGGWEANTAVLIRQAKCRTRVAFVLSALAIAINCFSIAGGGKWVSKWLRSKPECREPIMEWGESLRDADPPA